MSTATLTPSNSSLARDARDTRCAARSVRQIDCRRCSHNFASTSYSDTHTLLLPSRPHSRLRNATKITAVAPNDSVVVTERKATDSLREALKDTGPAKDLGYGGITRIHLVSNALFILPVRTGSQTIFTLITSLRKR